MDVKFNQAASAYKNTAQMAVDAAAPAKDSMKPDFMELVGNSLNDAMSSSYKTESISTKSLANKTELTDLVMAVGNTELTLNTVVAVRDRVISAYQDIIRMPI